MKQYNAIKAKYPDALLLFRVGDFYETFGSDAVKAAKILDIILTKRGAGSQSETELAGFPHHSLNTYLPKLVKAGARVAICDQLEDPKKTKTIVKRGVTELITPGVSLNDEVLSSKTNNFLAAVYFGKTIGVAFLDVSTGEFLTAQGSTEYIGKLLQNFNPSEVLIEKQKRTTFNDTFGTNFHTFYLEDWVFQQDYANESLCKHFQSKTLKGFGVDTLSQGIIASGAVMHYLAETQHHKLQHITAIERILEDDYVWMDKFTIRNLELYNSYNANAVTLIDVIDHTISPMGGRLLKRWLALPLKTIDKIDKYGIATIIDCHSFSDTPFETDLNKTPNRPDILLPMFLKKFPIDLSLSPMNPNIDSIGLKTFILNIFLVCSTKLLTKLLANAASPAPKVMIGIPMPLYASSGFNFSSSS